MLSPLARAEWSSALVSGVLLVAAASLMAWWWTALAIAIVTLGVILFFRDPTRPPPTNRHVAVSPADGKISSIHRVESFEPFGEPALCVRVFLSVFDVHVVRTPLHGMIRSIEAVEGRHANALSPRSAEDNAATWVTLNHPVRQESPVAVVRLIAGMFARSMTLAPREGEIVQRGQRLGIIKLGSTAELYLPESLQPEARLNLGDRVKAGVTIVASVTPVAKQDGARAAEAAHAAETGTGDASA